MMDNDDFADKLTDEEDAEITRQLDVPIAYVNEKHLRATNLSDSAVDTIMAVKNGTEDYSELMEVNGVGPKTAEKLYKRGDITTVEELKQAVDSGRLGSVVGDAKADHISHAVEWYGEGRLDWEEADRKVETILDEIGHLFADLRCVGSYRRHSETVGDLDMLGIPDADPTRIRDVFKEKVSYVIRAGEVKMTGRWLDTQVDIQLVSEEEWPAALQYFTGSQEHNVDMRQEAIKKGYKLNEYGLWDRESDDRVSIESERELYKEILGKYVKPTER